MKNLILIWAILFSSLAQAYPLGTKGAGQSSASYPAVIDFGDQAITTTGSNVKVVSANSKNYITAIDGSKIGNWVTYADAAGTAPVDGTGGSPTVTFAVSTDSSLRGSTNFLFSHGASNQQGQGFSYAFSIDPSDTGKVLRVDMDYMVSSGTYADDDIQFWIYDVTNAALIQPAPFKLKNTLIKDHFALEFQSSLSTSYRLIGHVATTTATAYGLRFTNFSVGQFSKIYSTSDPSFRAKISSAGVVSDEDHEFITGNCSVTGTSVYTCTLNAFTVAPNCQVTSTAGNAAPESPINATVTATSVAWETRVSNGTLAVGSTVISCKKTGADYINATSGRVSSSESDTRIVSFSAFKNAGSVTANTTIPTWTTVSKDTHGAFNATTGVYTIPIAGDYFVDAKLRVTSGTPTGSIYKNGTLVAAMLNNAGTYVAGTTLLAGCVAGDTITIAIDTSLTLVSTNTNSIFNIYKLSGPSQIQASETVAASYWLSASFNTSTTIPINFDSKEFDTHGAVTTSATAWKFTAPISGIYSITTKFYSLSGQYALYKNGTIYKNLGVTASSVSIRGFGSTSVKLLAGEYIDVRGDSLLTVTGGALSASDVANIAITRTGNY